MDDSGRPVPHVPDGLLLAAARSVPSTRLLLDPAGRLVVASQRAEQDLGVAAEDVGRPLSELEVGRNLTDLTALVDRARTSGGSLTVRGVADRQGRRYDVLVESLIDHRGPLGLAITFTDGTADESSAVLRGPQKDPATPGAISVVDLFVVLVENHRLEVREAVRRLTGALLREGYPADADSVGAADAMDILDSVLDEA